MFLLVIITYVLLAVYEFLPLYKEKNWADIYINAVLFTLSLTLALMLCFGVRIPSPSTPIMEVIISIFGK